MKRYHFEFLAALWCIAAFAWIAIHGLRSGYFPDDLMNLYQAWVSPWKSLALGLIVPSDEAYRPTGALALKVAFLSFGLNPLPLRAICIVLIVLNAGLHFTMVRTLSRSHIAAALSVCIFSFHAMFSDLYLSSATIYDLLAFAFVHVGMLAYILPRSQGRPVSWKGWALIWGCAVLAAGAKEVGMVLPVMLIGYEAIFQKRVSRGGLLLAAVSTLRAVWLLHAPNGVLRSNAAYSLQFDRSSIGEMTVAYTRMLLLDMGLGAAVVYFVLAAIVLLALIWRSPEFRFGALLFFFAAAPLVFIAPRSMYVLYLAYSGWCMLWATALVRIPLPPAVTLAVAAVLFGTSNVRALPHTISWAPAEQARVRCALEAVGPLAPHLAPEARILITADPFPPDDYMPVFAFRLHSGIKDLAVWRLRTHPQAAEWADPWSLVIRIDGCRAAPDRTAPI